MYETTELDSDNYENESTEKMTLEGVVTKACWISHFYNVTWSGLDK